MWTTLGFSGLYLGAWLLASQHLPPFEAVLLSAPLIWLSVVDLDRFEIPDLANATIFLGGIGASFGAGWPDLIGLIAEMSVVFLLTFGFSLLAARRLHKTA